MTLKPHSRNYAEVFTNDIMQRRVHLGDTKEVRLATLQRLYREVTKAARHNKEALFYIDLKYE